MPARLNRRRYSEVVRLLKEVIGNPKAGLARRMRAAQMVIDIYDRHDKRTEAVRKDSIARSAPVQAPRDTETARRVSEAEAQARAFLAVEVGTEQSEGQREQ